MPNTIIEELKNIQKEIKKISLFEQIKLPELKELMQNIIRGNREAVQSAINKNKALMNTQVVIKLTIKGENVLVNNRVYNCFLNPLHLAMFCNQKDIATFLLEEGASPNDVLYCKETSSDAESFPFSTLYLAIATNNSDIVDKCLEKYPLLIENYYPDQCINFALQATQDFPNERKTMLKILLKHNAHAAPSAYSEFKLTQEYSNWLKAINATQTVKSKNKEITLGEKIIAALGVCPSSNENKNFLTQLKTLLITEKNDPQEIFNAIQDVHYQHNIHPSAEMVGFINIVEEFCLKLNHDAAFNNYLNARPQFSPSTSKKEISLNNKAEQSTVPEISTNKKSIDSVSNALQHLALPPSPPKDSSASNSSATPTPLIDLNF